jgi:hypothetical protein
VRVTGWRVDERPATSTEPHSDHAPVIVEIRPEVNGSARLRAVGDTVDDET